MHTAQRQGGVGAFAGMVPQRQIGVIMIVLLLVVSLLLGAGETIQTVHAVSNATICRPLLSATKTASLETFLVGQWELALRELDLTADGGSSNAVAITAAGGGGNVSEAIRSLVYSFNHFHSGCVIYMYGKVSTPVTYCKIWKNANEAIRKNLWLLVMKPCHTKRCHPIYRENAFYPRGLVETPSYGETENILRYYSKNKLKSTKELQTFTFLRDPLDHFVSGLSESMHRTAYSGVSYSRLLRNVTTDTLSMYISSFLQIKAPVKGPHLKEPQHFYPMAGVFMEWPIHHVGFLEDFSSGWDHIRSVYGITEAYNSSHGIKRTTEKDPSNVRSSFKELAAKKPKFLRAICHMIMLDYVCFPKYKLPEECKDMVVHRQRGEAIFH